MNADRFKFEQELGQLSNTEDDIDLLIEHVLEDDADPDEIANTLMGIQRLFSLRLQRVFNTFEALVHNGDIKAPNYANEDDE